VQEGLRWRGGLVVLAISLLRFARVRPSIVEGLVRIVVGIVVADIGVEAPL
jgi:hypothetical protein